MNFTSYRNFVLPLLGLAILCLTLKHTTAAEPATAPRGMVATVHPLATDAGVQAMREGGNAVDAAVAAALTLGVVDNHNSGIGGGCFILIRRPDGQRIAIDGRETAPGEATRDMFLRSGKPQRSLSKTGSLAIAVPGALAAYDDAIRHFGRRKLKDLLQPAAQIAAEGFPLDRVYARRLQALAPELRKFEGSRKALLKGDGSPYKQGEILKQRDLAHTYTSIAEQGVDWFYRGPFAHKTQRWMENHGGLITADDFARYRAKRRQPIVTTYRGLTIVGFPPPSSGGIHIAQMLNTLESLQQEEPTASASKANQQKNDGSIAADWIHLVAEAMKPAFADRAHWLGDADYAKVPRGLIDKAYAKKLARRIDPKSTIQVQRGEPLAADARWFGGSPEDDRHTTHIAAADAEGNWVAITATVNTGFGSKVVIPGTGVVMNNEMDDFSIAPGVPNAFGLIGAEANAVAPYKRPLSSMSPTIVLKGGKPILTLGAAGGPKIITQVLLTVLRHFDLNMSLPQAVAAPRFHHQWAPDVLFLERAIPREVEKQLQLRGHKTRRLDAVGVTQAIGKTPSGKLFLGVHDPRIPGKAAGW